jgi:hypothetical protein
MSGTLKCLEANIEESFCLEEQIVSKIIVAKGAKYLKDLDDSFDFAEDKSKVYGIIGNIYYLIKQ